MTLAGLSSKRVSVEAPLIYIEPTLALRSLARIANGPDGHRDLHLTLLHVGRLPELIDEIATYTQHHGQPDLLRRRLIQWLSRLPSSDAFTASSSEVHLYGPPHARVAALNLEPDKSLVAIHSHFFASLVDVLDQLGVSDPRRFIEISQALGFTSSSWNPHVTIGSPMLPESSYPVECGKLVIGFGPSHIRNLNHVASNEHIDF